MTAEVGVMNRIGVALAADSAVAVGPTAGKVYTSADKLFQLSENAPVGVMVYGNAHLLYLPWETIIKAYRSQLGPKTFDGLFDYADDFLRYLKAARRMFSADDQRHFVSLIAVDFFSHLREQLKKMVELEIKHKGPLGEAQISRLFTEIVRKELSETRAFENFEKLPSNTVHVIRARYRNILSEARRKVFEKLPISKLTGQRLSELAAELLSRDRLVSGNFHSGVVIAGFGEREHFPSLVEIIIPGIIADRPHYKRANEVHIGREVTACLVPFAQREMVSTFMDGVDPDLRAMVEESTQSLFYRVAELILAEVKAKHLRFGKSIEKKAKPGLDRLVKALHKLWEDHRKQEYTYPVMEMVSSLPKDELGAMAESLVNLTKFKRRVSKQQETVGGPIDVAVITKGDGFVWVKRKHYFDPQLNPRFIARIDRRAAR